MWCSIKRVTKLAVAKVSYPSRQARSQGGGGVGAVAPPPLPPQKKMPKKRGKGRERQKRKIKLRVCIWSCRLSTISKVRLNINSRYTRKYRAYAPNCTINNMKMQKALTLWEGGHPPRTHPPPHSAPSHVIFTAPPPLKLNPGYATASRIPAYVL